MKWQNNIVEWTGLGLEEDMLRMTNREGLEKIVILSSAPLQHPHTMG